MTGERIRSAALAWLLLLVATLATPPAAAQAAADPPPGQTPPAGAQEPPALGAAATPSSDLALGFTVQATFSDNFNLAPEETEASGRALELSPYLNGYLRTARSRGDMALRLRGIWYSTGGSSDQDLDPDLRANGDLGLVGDRLRLAGSAYVFRTSPSPFAATSVDQASRTAQSQLYKAYALSPYSLGQIGSADYELRYRGQVIDTGSAGIKSASQQIAGGLASSPRAASALGWSTRAETERIDFEGDQDLRRSSAEALLYYNASTLLRFGVGVNHSKVDVLVDEDGDDSGFGPTAFFSWRPGARTYVMGKFADTYYGSESILRLTHRGGNWVFGLNYLKGLQAGTGSGLLYFDPNAIFALPESAGDDNGAMVRGLAERRVFNGAGQALLFGQTGSPLVMNQSVIASVAFHRPRNSLALTLFANEQEPTSSSLAVQGVASDLTQQGITLTGTHRLRPASSVFIGFQYLVSESDQSRQDARLSTLTGGWQLLLSRRTAFSIALRGARQRSEGDAPSAEYTERAVTASIDHRF